MGLLARFSEYSRLSLVPINTPLSSTTMSAPTAIVIGAGLSGLSCAAELVKAGYNVIVLEVSGHHGAEASFD